MHAHTPSRPEYPRFANNWIPGATGEHWTVRRRLMAILRASCMVLGVKRRNRGIGLLGHGSGKPALAGIAGPGADGLALTGGATALTVAMVLGGASLSLLAATPALAADAVCVNPADGDTPVGVVSWPGNQVACGEGAVADGNSAIAIGVNAKVNGGDAGIAIGPGAVVDSDLQGLAIGLNAYAGSRYANAFGTAASATGEGSLAVGQNAVASSIGSQAFGSGAQSTSVNSTAVGPKANAAGGSSLAVGHNAQATASGTFAGGASSTASGTSSTAIGLGSTASNTSTVALGAFSNASGSRSIAIGREAAASATNSMAFGYQATAVGTDTIALGVGAGTGGIATNSRNIAIGPSAGQNVAGSNNTATGVNAGRTVTGGNNTATGLDAGRDVSGAGNTATGVDAGRDVIGGNNTAAGSGAGRGVIGSGNAATGVQAGRDVTGNRNVAMGASAGQNIGSAAAPVNDTIAIGTNALADSDEAVAVGPNAVATGGRSVSIGSGNVANGDGAVAIGDPNTATGTGAIAQGFDNTATGDGAVAMGNTNMVGGGGQAVGVAGTPAQGAVGIGYQNTVSGSGAVAIGDRNSALAGHAIAIGTQTSAGAIGAIAIGREALASGLRGTAIGQEAEANGSNSTALGSFAAADGNSSIAIGNGADSGGSTSIALGNAADASGRLSIAQGGFANASSEFGIALGFRANASVDNGVALGSNSVANTANGVAGYNPVTGLASTDTSATWRSTHGAVSVGNAAGGVTRQITGVAAGTQATDAVNVAQLQAAQAAATTHYYSVNDGGVIGANYNNDGATGTNALAAGVNASATGTGGIATGYNAIAQYENSLAIGTNARAQAGNGIAMGSGALANGNDGVAIGTDSSVSSTYGVAIGLRSAAGYESTALGGVANAGRSATAVGFGSNSAGQQSAAFGAGSYAASQGSVALGAAAVANNANDVALGSGSVTAAAVATTGATVDGVAYSFAGTAPASTVSVGSAGNERTITNVAAGRLSASSTDAVNGSQLYATNLAVEALGYDLDTLGQSVAVTFGGTSTYDPVTNTVTGGLDVGGTTYTNVQGALDAVNASATAGWNISAQGANATNVAPGGAIDLAGVTNTDTSTGTDYTNIVVDKSAASNEVTFDLADDVWIRSSLKIGTDSTFINGAGVQVTNSSNRSFLSESALTFSDLGGGNSSLTVNGATGTINNMTNLTFDPNNFVSGQGATEDQLKAVSDVANAGWNITAQGANATNVAPGETIDLSNTDGNVVVAKNATDDNVTFDLASDLNIGNSITVGGTVLDTTGLTIAGGPSVTTAGIDAGGLVITNVAPGVAGTDAANMDQLNAVSAVANAGWNVTTGATGTGVAVGTTVHNIAPSATATFEAGDNLVITQTGDTVNYALNPDITVASVTTTDLTVNGDTYLGSNFSVVNNEAFYDGPVTSDYHVANKQYVDSSITNAVNNVNLVFTGNDGGAVTRLNGETLAIQGEATTAGTYSGGNIRTVTDPATGAVNIQLADSPVFGTVVVNDGGTGKITGVADGTLAAGSQDAVNAGQLFAVGTSTASALGGGSSFDPATGMVTASLAVGGNTYTNVQDALTAVNSTAAAGWNVTTSAVGSGTVSGTTVANVAPGSTATFTAGNNIAMTQNGTEVQIALADDISVNSVTTNSLAVNNGPTIDGNGIDMNGGRITNVGAGVVGTDVVNLSQLNSLGANILNQANTYTDTQISALRFDLSEVNRDARGGTASAMAMSQVPQAFEPGMGMMGVGVSNFMGEQAVAFGFSKASDNGRVVVKAAGSYNTRGEGGVAAGVGFQF